MQARSYGFGVSYSRFPIDVVEQLLELDDRRGDFVTMSGTDKSSVKPRIGCECHLPISMVDFKHSLSIRARRKERPEVLEQRALIMGVQWLLRSISHVGKRVVVLLDSRVAFGASRKGRSGAHSLSFLIKRLAALTLISGLLVSFLYVPTEFNPADRPSRGPIRRIHSRALRGVRRSVKKSQKFLQRYANTSRQWV